MHEEPNRFRFMLALLLLLTGATACSQERAAQAQIDASSVNELPHNKVAQRKAVYSGEVSSAIQAPTFFFVGESWVGKIGYFAIQDADTHASAWHRIGDRIGLYEIVGSRDGAVIVRANDQEYSIPLKGIQMTQTSPEQSSMENKLPLVTPTIKVWANGVAVEATPDRMPPELLKAYTDSKEAMLAAKVPANLEPLIAQGLESTTVYLADGRNGLNRSDMPPEVSAQMSDETLAKINAEVRTDPAFRTNASTPK